MKRQTMYMRMLVASLMRRRSRMLVALLAIAVGATILSGLLTIYYDVPRQMGAQFRSYGSNMIFVDSGQKEELNEENVSKAVKLINDKQLIGYAPYRYESLNVNNQPVVVAGTNFEGVQATSPYWHIDGSWPNQKKEALVGKEIAKHYSLKVGDKFKTSYKKKDTKSSKENKIKKEDKNNDLETEFEVKGILDTGGKEEEYIFISTEDLNEASSPAKSYDVVELSISASHDELEKYVENISQNVSGLIPRLVKRVTQSETTVLSKLQALVFLVTIVVLLLTMICVTTTMMAVVAERRKEIGLRKALGAADSSIIVEFMGEGLMLGGIGGIIGACFGFAFAQAVSVNVFNSSISFQPLILILTILASIFITGIACLFPVRRATDVDPAVVLKGE